MSSVVLISDLLYQSAAIVFLDGSRVSEGLAKVSYGKFQGISVSRSFWYHVVRLLLVSFILGDSNWGVCFLQVGYPVDSPTNCALKQTPFGIPP